MGLFICCDLVSPLLPPCPYLLYLLALGHHMHRDDVTGDGAGIGQTRDRSTIQSRKRHNEPMTYLLWTCRNSARADSLMQWNIGHHNIWSQEQRRLQAKNLWTKEQASHR